MAKAATAHHTVILELCSGFCTPDTAFWQSQFLGMTHSRPARTLFEWCSHSVNVLWGANCFNTTTFLLNSWAGLFKVVYPRLYGMSWRHFTVSINPEFLAKFTLGGNVAIVLIKWFYGEAFCAPVHDSISNWTLFMATSPASSRSR